LPAIFSNLGLYILDIVAITIKVSPHTEYIAWMRCINGLCIIFFSQTPLFPISVKITDFLSVLAFPLRISGNWRIGVARF
jgi:hypothetical protein